MQQSFAAKCEHEGLVTVRVYVRCHTPKPSRVFDTAVRHYLFLIGVFSRDRVPKSHGLS